MASAGLGLLAMPVSAQVSQVQVDRLVLAAQAAAVQAQRAAAAARAATAAAEEAAKAAQVAADAARAATGGSTRDLAAVPGDPPGHQSQVVADETGVLPDACENLPVQGNVGESACQIAKGKNQTAFADALPTTVANGANSGFLKSTPTPDFQLLASSKDKVGSLAWTFDITGISRSNHLSADQLTLTASGSLDDKGNAQILGLTGFAGDAEFKFGYTHFSGTAILDGKEKDEVATARRNCLERVAADAAKTCDPYVYATGVSDFVAKYYPDGYRALIDTVFPGPVWFYGVQASGSEGSYKFLDRATFAQGSKSRFGYGATAFVGALLGSGMTSVDAAFTWKRAHKSHGSITLCQPISASVQTQCITAPDGAPDPISQAILSLEFRHAFPIAIGSFASLAIAPVVSDDVRNKVWSIDVPLYFAGDGSGKMRGGVRATYLNEKGAKGGRSNDLQLGLFVGVPFSVFHQ